MTVPLNLDTFYTLSHSSVSTVDFEHVNVCQNIDINFVEHSDGVYCVTFKNCIFLQGINQKITIGTVRPQLGKRASRCAGGGGSSESSSPNVVVTGSSPIEKIFRP